MEVISLICWVLAALCNAVMDTLAHHYPTSIFTKWDPQFWNPAISWKNKYKEGIKAYGPAFFLSTGMLVLFTDGWHLFKSMMIVLIGIAIVTFPYSIEICIFSSSFLNGLLYLSILGVLWNVPFSYFYNNVLKK